MCCLLPFRKYNCPLFQLHKPQRSGALYLPLILWRVSSTGTRMPVMETAEVLLWFRCWVNINLQELSAGGVQIAILMVRIQGFLILRPGYGRRLALQEVLH